MQTQRSPALVVVSCAAACAAALALFAPALLAQASPAAPAARPPRAGQTDEPRVDAGPEPAPAVDTVGPSGAPGADAAAGDAAPDVAHGAGVDVSAPPPTPAASPPAAADPLPGASVDDVAPSTADAVPAPDPGAPAHDPDAEPPPAPPPPDGAVTDDDAGGFSFGGVPAINYDNDNGFGFGIIGTLYYADGETRPYRLAVTLQLFMTTKLVQDHNIQVDWLRAFGLPLRINSRVGYLQSLTQNFCGFGGDVTCDPDVARAAGKDEGLSGAALDAFARRYYQRRFISPYGLVNLRWMLFEAKEPERLRVELLAGYRGFGFIPGNWVDEDGDGEADLTPYPGSLYEQQFPSGEPGFSSVLQAGVIVDTRDHEPYPTEGLFLEATVRGASPVWGSTWSFAGGNVTLRGFTPLTDARSVVLATRLVADGVLGDPPVQELARLGGTLDNYAFGGGDMGRGIRVQRFLGKVRLLNQTELRWRFLDFSVLEQRFALAVAGLVDSGVVAASFEDMGAMPLQVGFGGGLRVGWNDNFWIRFDVAVSPAEAYAPSFYVLVNNPF